VAPLLRLLLQKNDICTALRLVAARSAIFEEPGLRPADFLKAASKGDEAVFYSAFRFFESRNALLRASPAFVPSDGCDEYVRLFQTFFGVKSVPRVAARTLQ